MSVKDQHVKVRRQSTGISCFASSTVWILESKRGTSGSAVGPLPTTPVFYSNFNVDLGPLKLPLNVM